jgi:hypothetical protein
VRLRDFAAHYSPAFIPLGMGVWLAHYGFHFVTGGLTILPLMQSSLLEHGFSWLGRSPTWSLGALLPMDWIFPLQVAAVLGGFFASLYVLGRRSLRPGVAPIKSLLELLPWGVMMLLLALASLSIFNLPMEMRGALPSVG